MTKDKPYVWAFENIFPTINEFRLGDNQIWTKCEECTEKMHSGLEEQPIGFFATLKLAQEDFSKEEYYRAENIYFLPTVEAFDFDKGVPVTVKMKCSKLKDKHNRYNRDMIMDYNFDFGHIHEIGGEEQ